MTTGTEPGELMGILFVYLAKSEEPAEEPKDAAERCVEEVRKLLRDLSTIGRQLSTVLRRKSISESAYLCKFHYEHLTFRLYLLRERAWDVMAALVGISREPTGKARFRESVLCELEDSFPEVHRTFLDLHTEIKSYVNQRNWVTHETRGVLELAFKDNAYIIGESFAGYDTHSEVEACPQEALRKGLKVFISTGKENIWKIRGIAGSFMERCSEAIDQKHW